MAVVRRKKDVYNIIMLNCIETKKNETASTFLLEPLNLGQGVTLGNIIRRGLLGDTTGVAITGVRINKFNNEFSVLSGVREDIIEVLFNLKNLIIKDTFLFHNINLKQKAFFHIKGPSVITASKFKLPKTGLQIINKKHYICSILDTSSLYCEIDIEKGSGYRLSSERESRSFARKTNTIRLDALFVPVKKVNFKIRMIHDSYGNLKESLIFDIETNSTISPKRILKETLKNILCLVSNLFISSDIIKIH